MKVYKYDIPIDGKFELELPLNAIPLTAFCQNEEPKMWAWIPDNEGVKIKRKFQLIGTGHEVEDVGCLKWIATFSMYEGKIIFHLFEEKK